MALKKPQKSLKKWTKQKWRTPSGKKSSETGEVYAPSATIKKLKSTDIILQIHDEIIIQTPDDIASKTAKLVQKEMENATVLDVPLYVDIKQNKNLANFNN